MVFDVNGLRTPDCALSALLKASQNLVRNYFGSRVYKLSRNYEIDISMISITSAGFVANETFVIGHLKVSILCKTHVYCSLSNRRKIEAAYSS